MTTAISWALGLLTLTFFVGGMWQLARALCRRRVGDEPHCGRCHYNLTSATSQMCPECGAPIDARSLTFGERRRTNLHLVPRAFALFALAVAGFVGFGKLQAAGKYRLDPFKWVLDGAKQDDPYALHEIIRRHRTGSLSRRQLGSTVKQALREQVVPHPGPLASQWMDLLDSLMSAQLLSDEQSDAYLSNLLKLRLGIRPQVRMGDRLPVSARFVGRGPWSGRRTIDILAQSLLVGTHQIDVHGRECRACDCSIAARGSCGDHYQMPDLLPGRYPITYTVKERILDRPKNGDRVSPPAREFVVELAGTIGVLPADAPDTVKLIDDPALANDIRNALAIVAPTIAPSAVNTDASSSTDRAIEFKFNVGPMSGLPSLPIDVAFDVVIIIDGAETLAGTLFGYAAISNMADFSVDVAFTGEQPIAIELRSNPDAARNTIDQFQIWDGTITYDAVEFKSAATGEIQG